MSVKVSVKEKRRRVVLSQFIQIKGIMGVSLCKYIQFIKYIQVRLYLVSQGDEVRNLNFILLSLYSKSYYGERSCPYLLIRNRIF